ncbi:methylmalonyl Co-A mutase-associated GTPase MeaB [Oligoflexia bacterium]|nr:methylmalonyl Co-A mutase-associated GTPase MeaB [Oligoflexia bacterium]
MQLDENALVKKTLKGDCRAIARLISLAENRNPNLASILTQLYKKGGKAHVVGVTGAPGAGKSTLVDGLALAWNAMGKKVGVLAVDPTSPFTGGAVLGDRVRMTKAAKDTNVFIRSMATRGSLGGLSHATFDAVQILEAAGYDLILIETVGVGQVEVDIMRIADACLVMLVPGMGDGVQAMKAGILEIADIFVINKADREGVDMLEKDLRLLLTLADKARAWTPEIFRTVATALPAENGIDLLLKGVAEHQKWLTASDEGLVRKKKIIKARILRLAHDMLLEQLLDVDERQLNDYVDLCFEKKSDPYTVVGKLLQKVTG